MQPAGVIGFVIGAAMFAYAACDPYGTDAPGATATDGGDASDARDGGATSDGGAGATYIAVLGGTRAPDADLQAKVYVTRVLDDGSLRGWTETAAMPGGRSRSGASWLGSSVFVVGGDGAPAVADTVLVGTLTPAGAVQSWLVGAPLPSHRFRVGSVAAGAAVYVIGGFDTKGNMRADVLFSQPANDGTIGTWMTTTPLPEPCAAFGTATDGKHVYVIAGERVGDGGSTQSSAKGWVADVLPGGALGSWRALPDLELETVALSAAATTSHVYATGGYRLGAYEYVRAAAIAANGLLGPWKTVTAPKLGRALGALVVARGRLYLIGGSTDAWTASVEVADIQPDGTLSSWRDATPLPTMLAEHAAVAFDAAE